MTFQAGWSGLLAVLTVQEAATSTLDDLGDGLGLTGIAETIQRVISYEIFELSGTGINLVLILTVGFLVVATWAISTFLQRAVERAFRSRGVEDMGTTAITKRLLHYAIMAIGLGIALETIGISLSALFAAGAIFAVGIGFAMQNIAQNFVSGLILLVERAIKPGDIVEVEGRVVRVLKMGIRTTIGRTRDEEEIIIPNASLVQSTVKNYTLEDTFFRIRAGVGVSYESDMRAVRDSLTRAANSVQGRMTDRDPVILLSDFGDSTVDWQVSLWTQDAWTSPRLVSELREAIWWALKEDGIEIAFPQIDVHFDPHVEEAVTQLPRAG
jgi:potassium-dependent mechanosensitive channel